MQEPADEECWACAHPSFQVWPICMLDVLGVPNGPVLTFAPFSSERFPPGGDLAITRRILEEHVKLVIIRRRQLFYKNPNKKVDTGGMEMMKEIMLDSPPA